MNLPRAPPHHRTDEPNILPHCLANKHTGPHKTWALADRLQHRDTLWSRSIYYDVGSGSSTCGKQITMALSPPAGAAHCILTDRMH